MHFIGTKQLAEVRHVLDRIETRVRTEWCHHTSRWCEALQGGGEAAEEERGHQRGHQHQVQPGGGRGGQQPGQMCVDIV